MRVQNVQIPSKRPQNLRMITGGMFHWVVHGARVYITRLSQKWLVLWADSSQVFKLSTKNIKICNTLLWKYFTKSPHGTNSMIIMYGCSSVQKPKSLTTFGWIPTFFIVDISPINSSNWSDVKHSRFCWKETSRLFVLFQWDFRVRIYRFTYIELGHVKLFM